MKSITTLTCLLGLAPFAAAQNLGAQEPPVLSPLIRVFLDCQTFHCDFDHFRREITLVDWVRDRQDAQVHILGTAQGTGGGGREYTFAFIGLREFAGRNDTLRYVSQNTDTFAETRDGQVQTVTVGLVRYVAATELGRELRVTLPARTQAQRQAAAADDPWNLWVFTVGVGGSLDGEQRERNRSFDGQLEANRTADNLKLSFEVFGEFERREQDLADEGEPPDWRLFTSHNFSAEQRAVWSLGGHWSFGLQGSQTSSTFLNNDLTIRGGPAVEFNLYPYGESTRRQLTFRYAVETTSFNYQDVTIFDKLTEVRPAHRLDVNLEVQQPWGSVETSVVATQFLHHLARHRINFSAELDVRIFRGLEFSFEGSVSRIKDQLYLARRDLTPEEILVRQRQLGTDYRYETFVGFQYRFGSKFANVVNPRMWQ